MISPFHYLLNGDKNSTCFTGSSLSKLKPVSAEQCQALRLQQMLVVIILELALHLIRLRWSLPSRSIHHVDQQHRRRRGGELGFVMQNEGS